MSVTTFDRLVAELDINDVDGLPFADKAIVRSQLSRLVRELKDLLDEVDRSILETMESDQVTVEGIGTFIRRHRGKRIRWDGEAIRRELLRQPPADPETGELVESAAAVAAIATGRLFEVAGLHRPSHSWSSTALNKYGLAPSQFSDWQDGGLTLEVVE